MSFCGDARQSCLGGRPAEGNNQNHCDGCANTIRGISHANGREESDGSQSTHDIGSANTIPFLRTFLIFSKA
jgi:hypothetical protein